MDFNNDMNNANHMNGNNTGNNNHNGYNNNSNNNNSYNNGYNPNGGYNSNGSNNQGGRPNPYGNPYTPPAKQPGSGLQTAAMVLGVLSIVTACMMTVYPPFIFGGLAMILALLSKGRLTKLHAKATAGIVCAIVGLVLNCGIIGYTFRTIMANPSLIMETARMYDDVIEQMYGVPSEEILGESMEDTMSQMYDAFGISE